MSGKSIFIFAFLIILVTTLAFPSFPPAQFLFDLLKIPQSTASFLGISANIILYGVANGFFWLLILLAVYGLYGLVSKEQPPLTMPVAPHLKTPSPEPMPVDNRRNTIRPSRAVRKAFTLRKAIGEYEVETIEGIGAVRGTLLKNMGIQTAEDLLRAGSTKRGRRRIALEVGVAEETVLKWTCQADLLRVTGVGKQYSELLESAGVNTAKDLSMRDPNYLHQTLKIVNSERKLVRRVPTARTIRSWVNDAKRL
jgi:predicted flap endonuclease-1-like 5' DNA nuclease